MGWYNSSWTYRQKITVDATKVDEVFSLLPIYTSKLNLDFFDRAKAGAADIRITQADGTTEIARYIVAHDATAHTGLILANVLADVSISTNTDYYVYYGNAAASDHATSATYGRDAVFAEYEGAYMPGMTLTDLTGGGRDLTAVGTPTTAASGYEGITAAVYNGSSQYHYNSGTQAISGWPITHELLAYAANVTGIKVLSGYAYSTTTHSYSGMYLNGGGSVCTHKGATGSTADASKSAVSATTWTYLAGDRDANTGTTNSYINGGTAATGTGTLTTPSAFDRFQIGAQYAGGAVANYTNGRVAVVLLSNSVRSANYINTMYNAWSDTAFFTAGAIETETGGTTGWVLFQTATTTSINANDRDWSNPSNALSIDANAATAVLDDTTYMYSEKLKLTNPAYGIAIPSGETTYGAKFRVRKSGQTSSSRKITDKTIKLIDNSGAEYGSNLADTVTAWPSTAVTVDYTFSGGSVTDSTFNSSAGLVVQGDASTSNGSTTASVLTAWMRVDWDTPAGGANVGSFFWGR